ncbi:MAG: hypothetical protein JJE41_16245, partial [Candidatus Heimdallarchaeota archaeon]|nr:hypothetical protein [Candidatus Heimdallarchaeota archaeon]
ILVESCESGEWADDFAETPYLAMSTSDEEHSSYYYDDDPSTGEGDFSHWFFEHVDDGYNAVESYYYACEQISQEQCPKKQDYSSYVWFS